jgi:hypothetical protein
MKDEYLFFFGLLIVGVLVLKPQPQQSQPVIVNTPSGGGTSAGASSGLGGLESLVAPVLAAFGF